MARKPVTRSLPKLSAIHPKFQGISTTAHRAVKLADLLRQTIQTVRQPHAVPFYSMQQVAEFSGVSLKTVRSAYRRLAAEGLLSLHRGSQTTLLGRQSRPRHPVRGVVAVVIWLPGFQKFLDWQFFFRSLENELSRHRFVADLILNEDIPDLDAFLERILAHHPDWLVWLNPNPRHSQLLNQFQDAGLRVVVIGDRPETTLPGQHYFLSWERALRTGLQSWRRDGIRHVVIPGQRGNETSLTHAAERVLGESGLPYSFHGITSHDLATNYDLINRLPLDAHTGVLFDDDMCFGYQFRDAPLQLLDLLRRYRVIVGRPIALQDYYLTDLRVDALKPDWHSMAKRIAADISSEKLRANTEMVTFHAAWHPRIEASTFLQLSGARH